MVLLEIILLVNYYGSFDLGSFEIFLNFQKNQVFKGSHMMKIFMDLGSVS